MIKAVIFDCFGVLTTDIWLAFCDSLPPSVDMQKARDINRAYDKGMIDHETFAEEVRAVTGQTPPDIESLKTPTKNMALLDYIGELRAKNYKIGMLSNVSSDWVTREFLDPNEQKLFDAIVLSYNTGMLKPDPKIYELCCERLGVAPNQAVFVDDREWYVEGARSVGMQAIRYENFKQCKEAVETLLANT